MWPDPAFIRNGGESNEGMRWTQEDYGNVDNVTCDANWSFKKVIIINDCKLNCNIHITNLFNY